MNIALVVIDMQKCFIAEYSDAQAVAECAAYINHTSRVLRNAGRTVIHVQDMEDAAEYSPEELGFIDEIEVDPADLRIQKTHSNAFWETDLDRVVTEKGIELLVLCGQAAEHCVVFTYNGARERGHRVVVLQNGVISQKPGRVAALMEDRHTISYPVIELMATQPSLPQ